MLRRQVIKTAAIVTAAVYLYSAGMDRIKLLPKPSHFAGAWRECVSIQETPFS